jgi:hypothetical protein
VDTANKKGKRAKNKCIPLTAKCKYKNHIKQILVWGPKEEYK